MSIHKILPFIGFCLIFSLGSVSAEDPEELTVYEMLGRFNLPKGILPVGVKSYFLHEDGTFEVLLDRDCKFSVDGGYSLNYRRRITGKVGMGSLKNLQGVSVKVLFMWLSITEVSTDHGQLDFYVGPLSASFPLSNFDESPRCGCGLNCSDMISDL